MKTCFHCTRLYYFPAGKPGPASEFGGEKRLQAPPLGHQSESELPLLVCQMPAKRVHIAGFNHSTTLYERARERDGDNVLRIAFVIVRLFLGRPY